MDDPILGNLFDWHCPINTFGNRKENSSKTILDRDKKPISSEFGSSTSAHICLPSYFDKAQLCYEHLSAVRAEHNRDFNPPLTLEVLADLYTTESDWALEMAAAINKRRFSIIDAETKEKVDIIEFIQEAEILADKFLLINLALKEASKIDDAYASDGISAFSALQCFDELIGAFIFNDSESQLEWASLFHDYYFTAVKRKQIIHESEARQNKERVALATKTKQERTNKRDEFICSLYRKTKLSRVSFSNDDLVMKKINDFSIKNGLKPLTVTGGRHKIYRLLKGR